MHFPKPPTVHLKVIIVFQMQMNLLNKWDGNLRAKKALQSFFSVIKILHKTEPSEPLQQLRHLKNESFSSQKKAK